MRLKRLGGLVLAAFVGGGMATLPAYGEEPKVREEVKQAVKEFFKGMEVVGDFRLRVESDFEQKEFDGDNLPDRHRQRVRGRLGFRFLPHEAVQVGVRLRTGNPDDSNSPHQTLGEVFDSFDADFDQWFATWQPSFVPGAWVTVGKFYHPFVANPVFGELVWDEDINPEGGVIGFSRKDLLPFLKKVQAVGGAYFLLEQAGGNEARLFVAQGAADVEITDKLGATLAVGWYGYSNLSPRGFVGNVDRNLDVPGSFDPFDPARQGLPCEASKFDRLGGTNRFIGIPCAGGDFASDFSIINPIVSLTYTGLPLPVTVAGEWITNFEAKGLSDDDENGWSIGAAVGSRKKKGDIEVAYQWRVIEQDSVFSDFVHDDQPFGTNYRGHYISFRWRPANKIEVRPWFQIYRFEDGGPVDDKDQIRMRFDFNIFF